MINREAYRFFCETAGGRVGFQAVCAAALARAEATLQAEIDLGLARILWELDEDPDLSWCDKRDLANFSSGRWEMLCCRVERRCLACNAWRVVECLGGIVVDVQARPRDTYPRVVEAELALTVDWHAAC